MRVYKNIFLALIFFLNLTNLYGTTFIVSSSKSYDDIAPGNNTCYTGYASPDNCTLKAAIQEANAHAGADEIIFDRHLTFPSQNLPDIESEYLTIDGSSQWDVQYSTPGIIIINTLVVRTSHTTIKGIGFHGSNGSVGVHIINGTNNHIGGYGNTERNIFLTDIGVILGHTWSEDNIIQNNYFGFRSEHDIDYHNDIGIYVDFNSHDDVIENNVIGNCNIGISMRAGDNILIKNNIFGRPRKDYYFPYRIPNGYGIKGGGQGTIEKNNISDSTEADIEITSTMQIKDNIIGTKWMNFDELTSNEDGIRVIGQTWTNISNNTIYNINGNGIYMYGIYGKIANNEIYWNKGNGIHIKSSNIEISNNYIMENSKNGILIDGSNNIDIYGNKIGMWSGTSSDSSGGNGQNGISIINASTDNTIGGLLPGKRNYIGYNEADGIYIGGTGTRNNYVVGNTIGANDSSTPRKAGNKHHGIAIYDNAESNHIGQLGGMASPNLIVDNYWRGIAIINSNYNEIFANLIGTNNGDMNWGNAYSGIQIAGYYNTMRNNIVANNGFGPALQQAGIIIEGASSFGNRIIENSIFNNASAGIDLIDGGNQDIQAPLLYRNGKILSGTTYPNSKIEIFSGPDQDEGKYYEGFIQADDTGAFQWTIDTHVQGRYITATTTTQSIFNTSEFSLPVAGYIFPLPAIIFILQ